MTNKQPYQIEHIFTTAGDCFPSQKPYDKYISRRWAAVYKVTQKNYTKTI